MIFIASEKRSNLKKIQSGNREWVTIIQGICAAGWAIPPFVIFAGRVLLSNWYAGMPHGWAIEVSPNGWTINELALAWLKHFDTHTKERTVGAYRLLIMDGHGSHNTKEFYEYCEEHKTIVLYMPPHSSCLLQPLDVGCFAPPKRAYYAEIDSWSPTPPLPQDGSRESKTPSNLPEVEAQTTLVREGIRNHRGSPISPLLHAVDSLAKGISTMGHNSVLQTRGIAGLRKAIDALTEQRSRRRKYVRAGEGLTVGNVLDLIAEKTPEQPVRSVRGQKHCGRCGKLVHNTRTCTTETVYPDDSDASE